MPSLRLVGHVEGSRLLTRLRGGVAQAYAGVDVTMALFGGTVQDGKIARLDVVANSTACRRATGQALTKLQT